MMHASARPGECVLLDPVTDENIFQVGRPVDPPLCRRRRATTARRFVLAGFFLLSGACLHEAACAADRPSDQPTEQRWIIGAVARDLADLAVFASGPEPWTPLAAGAVEVRETADLPPGQNYSLAIALPGGEPVRGDLKIIGSVWSPELYVPTLRALFARLKLAPPATTPDAAGTLPDADLLKALTNPLTAEIEAQNQRLSGWLQTHPLDARAHEQAALLLGTLAMRENSGLLWNPRGLCNRAVAHLAFARAIRSEPSDCGAVAELLVGLIIDTKADCQKRIAALRTRAATRPELGPWVMAAALRNTRDYRLLDHPQDATLLERIELFRALSEAVSTHQAIARMDRRQPANIPDWERIVLECGYGVEAGHVFALPAVGLELSDAAQIFPDLRMARAPAQFAALFNPPPDDLVQTGADRHAVLRVIDRGTWAQFFQRHLLQAADQTYHFLKDLWGVPDEARSFRAQTDPLLNRLTLYPLCLDGLGKEDAEAFYPRAVDLLSQHPEWVGDGAWANVVEIVPGDGARGGSWAACSGAWFSPRLPIGTVYGFGTRAGDSNFLPSSTLAELTAWHDIAPLKYDVCRAYLVAEAPNHRPGLERYKEVMAPLLPYYLPALKGETELIRHNDAARYGAVMNQVAALDPTQYLVLGSYYVGRGMEPEAAQAYQAMLDHEAEIDAVQVSNGCSWLVNYYYEHGQAERALTIARHVADAYSYAGLETLASLLERMGRHEEAESYYQKIDERYHDAQPLGSFHARQADAHPEDREKAKDAEREVFPGGMEDITLARLSGKPDKGVIVKEENSLSRAAGLKLGAIIVGFDGKRVSNVEQYRYVRGLKDFARPGPAGLSGRPLPGDPCQRAGAEVQPGIRHLALSRRAGHDGGRSFPNRLFVSG